MADDGKLFERHLYYACYTDLRIGNTLQHLQVESSTLFNTSRLILFLYLIGLINSSRFNPLQHVFLKDRSKNNAQAFSNSLQYEFGQFRSGYIFSYDSANPFHRSLSITHGNIRNQRFINVFTGYRKKIGGWNGLISILSLLIPIQN